MVFFIQPVLTHHDAGGNAVVQDERVLPRAWSGRCRNAGLRWPR